jgi:CubicO group peptidase (beta-lactamase class C family)
MRGLGWGLAFLAVAGVAGAATAQTAGSGDPRQAMLDRARRAELPGTWTPAPVDPLSHHLAGYAQRLCSAVFIAGMDLSVARQTLGDNNALAPVAQRIRAGEPEVDRARREVRVQAPGGLRRTARQLGSQGCVILPEEGQLGFTPSRVEPDVPDAAATPWPMGDRLPAAYPAGLDRARVEAAVNAAFTDDALTQAVVVTWRGQIVGERYGLGATMHTPLEGWSMGKSIVATLIGVLIEQGAYTLDQPAPIPEWQRPGDPRSAIRIREILQMSSGLRIRAQQDPDHVPDGRLADHWYYYTAPDAFAYAASRPLQWAPGAIGRYRNTDPVLGSYLVRLAVEARNGDYHAFPQRALFDRIGIRSAVLEVDARGNFLTQGAELLSARDWARLGNLYLQDGSWNGEQVLPRGFARFVSTVAPAWQADGRPIYGGFFWINGMRQMPIPEEAYSMQGAGGQFTIIIPSHDLVVVRLGRYAGERPGREALNRALQLLVEAVPQGR